MSEVDVRDLTTLSFLQTSRKHDQAEREEKMAAKSKAKRSLSASPPSRSTRAMSVTRSGQNKRPRLHSPYPQGPLSIEVTTPDRNRRLLPEIEEESEVPGAESVSHRSTTLSSDDAHSMATELKKLISMVNDLRSEQLELRKSHNELATVIVDLKAQINSDKRELLSLSKRGTSKVYASEIISEGAEYSRDPSPARMPVSSVLTGAKILPDTMVDHRGRPTLHML